MHKKIKFIFFVISLFLSFTVFAQETKILEGIKEKTSYNELDEYQKRRDAERKAELEKARAKLKKNEVKSNFIASRKDWSIYGGWVNANLSVNVGKLGSTQGWRIEKPENQYY